MRLLDPFYRCRCFREETFGRWRARLRNMNRFPSMKVLLRIGLRLNNSKGLEEAMSEA